MLLLPWTEGGGRRGDCAVRRLWTRWPMLAATAFRTALLLYVDPYAPPSFVVGVLLFLLLSRLHWIALDASSSFGRGDPSLELKRIRGRAVDGWRSNHGERL